MSTGHIGDLDVADVWASATDGRGDVGHRQPEVPGVELELPTEWREGAQQRLGIGEGHEQIARVLRPVQQLGHQRHARIGGTLQRPTKVLLQARELLARAHAVHDIAGENIDRRAADGASERQRVGKARPPVADSRRVVRPATLPRGQVAGVHVEHGHADAGGSHRIGRPRRVIRPGELDLAEARVACRGESVPPCVLGEQPRDVRREASRAGHGADAAGRCRRST